jgi:hypothetical protein
MANNPKTAVAERNAALDASNAHLNNGYLEIYDGTQPTDADTAITTQNLLATCRFGATAFPAASGGSAAANAITSDPDAVRSGTPAWFRCYRSDGTTVVCDGSVGTSNADLILPTATIVQHGVVGVTSFTRSQPA